MFKGSRCENGTDKTVGPVSSFGGASGWIALDARAVKQR